jgi:RNA polymerase sigma-70 factor (ECF subfamily)
MLMARAQAGERLAYEALLRDILPFLRALARYRFRDARDVEDVVQDVLVTLHTIRHTYDPARPFRPWLATIARRRIVDHVRVRVRTVGRESVIDDVPETFLAAPTNEPRDEAAERLLRQALETLPAGQRQAVELLKLKDMSLKEASEVSGQSVGALKVAMHRALKTLKRALGAPDPE